jgi:hypothetical protein
MSASIDLEYLRNGNPQFGGGQLDYIQGRVLEMRRSDEPPVKLEYTASMRPGMSFEDDGEGLTLLLANGINGRARDYRFMAESLAAQAATRFQQNVGVIALNDLCSYDQATFTKTFVDLARGVKERAADGHRVMVAGVSRGGITVPEAAYELTGLDIVLDGVATMGSPYDTPHITTDTIIRGGTKEFSGVLRHVTNPRVMALHTELGARSMMRMAFKGSREGFKQELRSTIDAASPHPIVKLSQRGDMQVTVMHYEGDGIIDAESNRRILSVEGYVGRMVLMGGIHTSPFYGQETFDELLADMQKPKLWTPSSRSNFIPAY